MFRKMFSENKKKEFPFSYPFFGPKLFPAHLCFFPEVRYRSLADLFSTAICAAQQPPTAQLRNPS
jgi:hypothetical protein